MVAVSPVDTAVNPNNREQRYILWGNGRIDALGGAVPVTNQATWYARFEPPGVAIHVTDWATGSGYVLDYRGGFNPFGSAPDIGVRATSGLKSGVPEVAGIPVTAAPNVRRYVDWSWDPSGSGQGYVLDQWGQILHFGGAPALSRSGRRFTWGAARKFVMRWTPTKRGLQMDLHGGLWSEFAGTPAIGSQSGAYSPTGDYVRDVVVTNWESMSGYQLDLNGRVHKFGAAPGVVASTVQVRPGADVGRCLEILDASDPLHGWIVWASGGNFEFLSSTPPTVVAGGSDPVSPAATVTGTTRPVLTWTYSDPQRDSQAAWELYVFTAAWVAGHDMTKPALWAADALVAESGINPAVRGIACPVDLPNGSYRMYVRAKDTAGQWSAWSSRAWSQAVPLPTAPTGLTATADEGTFSVALSVSATTGGSAKLVRFEASDNAGGTWAPVYGADAVPLAAVTTATDRFPGFGVTRTYRAVAYAVDPAVASAPSNTATARLTRLVHALHALDAPGLGGEVHAVDPAEWTREAVAGVFQGIGADYPTVVRDGRPKARRNTLHLHTQHRAAWEQIEALAESGGTLVHRDPFGEVVYCELVGGWSRAQLPAAPLPGEDTPLRHYHDVNLPLVEVRPPHLAV